MRRKFQKIVSVFFCWLFVVILNFNSTAKAQETGLCGGEISANTIDPSRPSINALIIITHFPNDTGNPGHDSVPPFAQDAADFVRDYYLSMSYGKHTVNAQLIQRPAPNQGLAFDASNTILYYRNRITELNTEILDAAWNENNNVFNNIDFIFMCYEGNIYVRGTARGRLLNNSSHYSGDGVTMEYWWGSGGEEVLKWHFAHEYGHQIALPGNSIIWDQYIYRRDDPDIIPGPYDIMYYVHGGGTPPMAAFHLNYLGWLEDSWIRDIDPSVDGDQPNQIIKDTRIAPATGEYNAYRIEIPGTNEAFFIENRQGTSYDSELMGTGLIIWHVNGTTYPYSSAGQDVEVAVPDGPHGYDWLDDIPDGTSAGLGFATDFFNPTNKTQFIPWTNPSTETGYRFFDTHSPSGLAITNIDYDSGTDMKFDVIENFTSGEITEDSWWQGNESITGDITVTNGATLTVEPGASINFNSGVKLIINSTLDAQGTSSDSITFTSVYDNPTTSQYWKWIKFNDSADDNSAIEYAVIEYAETGIYCNNASPKIEHNTISNNKNYGIDLYYASPAMIANEITQNNTGIIAVYSNPYIDSSNVSNNSHTGLFLGNSSQPDVFNSSISFNPVWGIYCFAASPHLGPTSGDGKGCNVIRGNKHGVYAWVYSTPFLGSSISGNRVGGYNSIYDNMSSNAWASFYSHIDAQHNWWGQVPPDSTLFYSDGTSSIDYSNPLDSEPDGCSTMMTRVASDFSSEPTFRVAALTKESVFNSTPPDTNSLSDLWLRAKDLWLTGRAAEAIKVYKMLIRTFPETPEAKWALVKVVFLYKESKTEGLKDYLNVMSNKSEVPQELNQIAMDFLIGVLIEKKELNQAISSCELIIQQ